MEIAIIVVIFFILSNIGKKNRLSKGQNKPEERVPERRTPTPNKPVRPMVEKLKPTAKITMIMLAASCRNEIFRSAVGTFDPLHSGRGSRLVITTTSDSVRLTFRISSFIVTIVSGCLSLHLSLLLARLIGFCCRF